MLTEAKKIHPELNGRLVRHSLPSPLPFAGGSYDAVYSIAVLMHLEADDIEPAMREVHRILEPAGLFYFSVSLERPEIDVNGLDDRGRRFTCLSEEDWVAMGRACGFRVAQSGTNRDSMEREGIVWGNILLEKALP